MSWSLVYSLVWDALLIGFVAWMIWGGGMARLLGIHTRDRLPDPPRARTSTDYPEFRDSDRR